MITFWFLRFSTLRNNNGNALEMLSHPPHQNVSERQDKCNPIQHKVKSEEGYIHT